MAVAEGAAGVLKIGEIHVYDFTLPDKREHPFCFGEEDLVIFGCPTYAGRIPNKIMPFIRDRICGHGASAAIVMTYGGRSIDHSVMEAYLLLQENGRQTGNRRFEGSRTVWRGCGPQDHDTTGEL